MSRIVEIMAGAAWAVLYCLGWIMIYPLTAVDHWWRNRKREKP